MMHVFMCSLDGIRSTEEQILVSSTKHEGIHLVYAYVKLCLVACGGKILIPA